MSDVAAKVKEIVAEIWEKDPSELTEETSFVNDLDADSLDQYDLLLKVEEEFNLQEQDVEQDGVESIKTVGDVVKFVERQL